MDINLIMKDQKIPILNIHMVRKTFNVTKKRKNYLKRNKILKFIRK